MEKTDIHVRVKIPLPWRGGICRRDSSRCCVGRDAIHRVCVSRGDAEKRK